MEFSGFLISCARLAASVPSAASSSASCCLASSLRVRCTRSQTRTKATTRVARVSTAAATVWVMSSRWSRPNPLVDPGPAHVEDHLTDIIAERDHDAIRGFGFGGLLIGEFTADLEVIAELVRKILHRVEVGSPDDLAFSIGDDDGFVDPPPRDALETAEDVLAPLFQHLEILDASALELVGDPPRVLASADQHVVDVASGERSRDEVAEEKDDPDDEHEKDRGRGRVVPLQRPSCAEDAFESRHPDVHNSLSTDQASQIHRIERSFKTVMQAVCQFAGRVDPDVRRRTRSADHPPDEWIPR